MNVTGIIAEYNPFHNGHAYQMSEIKSDNNTAVIVVMSGNFVQRGEPAIINKYARAKAAIAGGADLVIELPVIYALGQAELFAKGAISILNSVGIVDEVCFGSESGNIDELLFLADFFKNDSRLDLIIKQYLDAGYSYGEANFKAAKDLLPNVDQKIFSSNNILGIEYIKALQKYNSPIKPICLKREGNDYNDKKLKGRLSSATSIREAISKKQIYKDTLPKFMCDILKSEFCEGRGPVHFKNFQDIILWTIRSSNTVSKGNNILANIYGMNEGIENRLLKAAEKSGNADMLVELIKSRRYPESVVKRLLFRTVLGITNEDVQSAEKLCNNPSFVRILDFSETGKKLLSKIKKSTDICVIVKASEIKKSNDKNVIRISEINSLSSDLYVLGYPADAYKTGGSEYLSNNYIDK